MIPRFGRPKKVKPEDIMPGDFVRVANFPGVGFVEAITDDGYADISWGEDNRSMLPTSVLRRVPAGGKHWDAKP